MVSKKMADILGFIMPPSPNLNLSRKIDSLMNTLGETARILDLGSGKRRRSGRIINIDLRDDPEVDILGDAHFIPVKDGSADAVIAQALLEHVRYPQVVVSEIHRVLKKGGYIYAEIPFLQPFHAAPEDYSRFTLPGIETLLGRFEKVDSGVCVGPTSAVCCMLMEYIPFVVGIPVIRTVIYIILGWLFFPIKYLDILLVRKKNAHYFSSSVYFFGRK